MQPDFTRPPKSGSVSPLAARLSSIAYALGFVSMSSVVLFLAAVPLGIYGLLANELGVLLEYVIVFLFLIPPLPTAVIAVVALRLMRNVSATVVQKDRAGKAMAMGFFVLGLALIVLLMKFASGGHL